MRTGFPVAQPGQRIGILGGSFDPPHAGHVLISKVAMRRLRLDKVWWLLSPGNPLKSHGPAPLDDRLAAARRLVVDPRIVVTDLEAQLGLRKTADTIEALDRLYPAARFVWLMGSDNLVQFHRWERWRQIAGRVPFAVLARPGSRMEARHSVTATVLRPFRVPEERASILPSTTPPAWVILNLPMSPMSSTQLRQGDA
ncbi:nicotinate-nucleotide adenylyltransferase [Paracoccus beibuensis]|uniref:nicotinate-nucleotide adenylyltransferase n=1 Tax=Paracoccus beibuensis TaxID=547602 RepID=UPI00223F059E|nr:nicotinate-nucleotide adenylyltransferase [Paracoccus beibuensis]